jgi:hypothetical protein
MNKLKFLISLILLTAISSIAQAAKPPKDVALLINKEEQLDDKCRGGSGDDSATIKACERRDVIFKQIEAKNWCWGKDGDFEYQKKWQKCPPK